MSDRARRNRRIATGFLADLGGGNMEGLFAALADDVVLVLPGTSLLPWAGTYEGHEGITTALTRIGEGLDIKALDLQYTVADDERAMMVTDERLVFKPTGVEFSQRVTWAFDIGEDGKITRWEMFEDTEAVANAARSS